MPSIDPATWSERIAATLGRYDEALVRQVAARLIRPRNEWPLDDLLARCVAAVGNAVVIDRRLKELDVPCRRLLALIGHSGQPRWRLGSLLEMLAALGHAEGPRPIFTLFETGLLFPDLPPEGPRLKSFEQWLGQASVTGFAVFASPLAASRAVGEDLGLPDLAATDDSSGPASPVQEADGLDWLLRLSVVWQQAAGAPLRRTQQGGFFKRDLDRLSSDPLLNSHADAPATVPDPGLLAVCLAREEELLRDNDGELIAAAMPASWERDLPTALASVWAALPRVDAWGPQNGWRGGPDPGNPFPAAYLLAMLLLARLPEDAWAAPDDVAGWVVEHHPYWTAENVRPSQLSEWGTSFLLGLAYPMRWVQARRTADGTWQVRLSALGRWLLGLGDAPAPDTTFPRTLLVQPNLEIIAYRQGLTPGLIARLAALATWKSLGAACILQIEADSAHRAMEAGLTFETILQTLEQHGTRATPAPVVESLRTWSNKRERISVYPAATVLEFATAEDLQEAMARGLPATRLSDRLVLVAQEDQIDFRQFRLAGTRDYSLPPDKCVDVDADGVTLHVDVSRSDLLLETELPRFAEPCPPGTNGRRLYRLTPESLAAARSAGIGLPTLENWFTQRAGQPLPAAARLLLAAPHLPPPELRQHLILQVASPEIADGLTQWPGTRALIVERLGPTALVVAEENAAALREQFALLGLGGKPEPGLPENGIPDEGTR